jgi:predicted CXXCH cytochrome family protein
MKLGIIGLAMVALAAIASEKQGDDEAHYDDRLATTTSAHDTVSSAMKRVAGGPHDFSGRTGSAGDACNACHVPHVQKVQVVPPPGDGREKSESADESPSLALYRMSGQRQVFVPDRYMPGPTSLICLSCHNGTVASSTIGSAHAMLAGKRAGFDVPDGFVWRDHPIGIEYPTGMRDYHSKTYAESAGIRLPEGRIECVTCHDPHGATGLDDMLTVSNKRSGLCLSCHIK